MCDAAFFRERNVIVVGGGDSAMEKATFLTKGATSGRSCTVARSSARADQARPGLENQKIEILTPYVVEEVLGEDVGKVTGVRSGTWRRRDARDPRRGFFVAIGHDPNTELFSTGSTTRGRIPHHEAGPTETNIAGVFAAGESRTTLPPGRTAAGTGCMAALDAKRSSLEQAHEQQAVAERVRT